MLKAIEPKRQYEACDECDGRMVAYNVAEFAASYTQSNADAIDDETWAVLVARARQLCADYKIDPRRVEFLAGPDEWSVGRYENWTGVHAIAGDELIHLFDVIYDQATGLDCLYAVACETCQDNGVILTASSREFGFDHAKCPDCK